jgi:hypothetical protein
MSNITFVNRCPTCKRSDREWNALQRVARAAEGLSHGVDWNNGTHAITHGYRKKLLDALSALKEA